MLDTKRISIIVAMDNNRVIGYQNRLPWRLPAELQYFKRVTMGHPIVMGRKTHESIGRPLPGRENIILTRNPGYNAEGCRVMNTVAQTIEAIPDNQEAFVIGGAEIIHLFLPHADKLYITHIDHEFQGDVWFPEIDPNIWKPVSREPGLTDENNPYRYEYVVYERLR